MLLRRSQSLPGRISLISPCQDMADAVSIAEEVFTPRVSVAKRKKELLEVASQNKQKPNLHVKGVILALRKKKWVTKKPKQTPQSAFLPQSSQSCESFWAKQQ